MLLISTLLKKYFINFRQESDVNFEDEDKIKIETALKNSSNKVVFAFFGKLKFKTDYLEETDSAAVVGFVVISRAGLIKNRLINLC